MVSIHFLFRGLCMLPLVAAFSTHAASPDTVSVTRTDAAELDMISAQFSAEQAPIAAVALAEIALALNAAKHRTEHELCNGRWSPSGVAVSGSEPELITLHSGEQVWVIQSLRRPQPVACEQISRSRFFLAMSRHLPEWIQIRPAGQLSMFRAGEVMPPSAAALASR
jgi:hypothetical protein